MGFLSREDHDGPRVRTVICGAVWCGRDPSLALLGRTRAVVLCVIADHPACTTTQLAQRARISPASASEHATTLRSAGLTTLTRERKAVLHTLTHLGLTLLSNNGSATPGA
ncbi:winged helix-turn-helix domain-containing protein [Streptomyces sp. NPDC002055]|uniref:winged helix-turn-helix domain-containing protein n=1 Tax=Streptomyces sp. NPDC002055 TaxID=3154534 RepID=UPI0033219FCE